MARIHRLVFVLLVLLSSISTNAHADYAVQPYYVTNFPSLFPSTKYKSVQEAADYQLAHMTGKVNSTWPAATHPWSISSISSINILYKPANSTNTTNYGVTKKKTCNGVEQAFEASPSGMCPGEPPPPCSEGQPVGPQGIFANHPVKPQYGCYNTCEVLWTPVAPAGMNCNFGGMLGTCWYEQEGGYKQTGAQCSYSNSVPVPPSHERPPPDCPVCDCLKAGKSWGTVNGVVACVAKGSAGSNSVSTTIPPSSTTTTAAPTTGNPNPTPVTTESNPVVVTVSGSSGGQPEVTETKTNPDGSTTTSTSNKEEYCKVSPNASICSNGAGGSGTGEEGEESSFSGSCDAFQCEGDAVQCAIAKKQHQDRCDDLRTDSTSDLGKDIIDGNASLGGDDPFENPLEIDVGSIDDSHFLASSCPADMVVPIYGRIPLSNLCTGLEIAGQIVLAFAYLIALGIIFKT